MNRFSLFLGLALFPLLTRATDVQVFDDSRAAVKAAAADEKLIVFLLADSKEESHNAVREVVISSLKEVGKEFVLANVESSMAANRNFFTSRYKKDLSTMPIAVVTNFKGEEIHSQAGLEAVPYRKMLIEARIKSGKITNPIMLYEMKQELSEVSDTENGVRVSKSFLAPMIEDLKGKKVPITRLRVWKKKDGKAFKALLLEALGQEGVFIDEKGDSSKLMFDVLSQDDVIYLQSRLKFQLVPQ